MNTSRNRYSRYNIYLLAFILMSAGGCIYLLYRPKSLLIFRVIEVMGVSDEVESLRKAFASVHLPLFVVNCLPAGLWAASYLLVMYGSTVNFCRKDRLMLSLPLPLSTMLLELMQAFGWCPGTFDFLDLLCYLIPVIIFIKSV